MERIYEYNRKQTCKKTVCRLNPCKEDREKLKNIINEYSNEELYNWKKLKLVSKIQERLLSENVKYTDITIKKYIKNKCLNINNSENID